MATTKWQSSIPSPTELASQDYRYEEAQRTWREVFHQNAYTNFTQIDYLVKKANVSWDAILLNPRHLGTRVTQNQVAADASYDFVQTWARSGRCTSFAVAVVRRLEESHASAYNFQFYDLGGHRVARCKNTGILIDSSSMHGAVQLTVGEWATFENDSRPSWKWIDGKGTSDGISKFEGTDGVRKTTGAILNLQQCMTIDTCEIKDGKQGVSPLFYFRAFQNEAEYWGMLKWDFKKHQVLLFRDTKNRSDKDKLADTSTIIFDHEGNAASEAQCKNTLQQFITQHGGPCGMFQWAANGGEKVHGELWEAAKRVWGMPRLVSTKAVHYIKYSPEWDESDYQQGGSSGYGLYDLQASIQRRSG